MRTTTMATAEHRAAWDARWRNAYATDTEADAAYAEHQRAGAELRAVFGLA